MESTHNRLAVVRIGVADTDGLVDKENVGMLVPAVIEVFRTLFGIGDPAGTYQTCVYCSARKKVKRRMYRAP
jgi:hypothetical protein